MKRYYVFAAAVALAGCKKQETSSSGSAAVSAPVPAPPPTAKTAPPAIATIDEKTLDTALAANGIKKDAVQQWSLGAHSAWALIAMPPDAAHHIVEYDLMRVDPRGVAMLPMTPTARKGPTWWEDDTTPLDVQDIDGDGTDECVFALTWRQDKEAARQMYVVGGAKPAIAATAILDYSTPSEHVEFHYEIKGKSLVLTRTANQLDAVRPANLTDPKTDPLLAGGTIPIAL